MVEGSVAALALLLAAVLLTAGISKLPARNRLEPAELQALGIPVWLRAPWAVRALPLAEIALAAALLVTPILLPVAVAALVLFVAFEVIVIRVALRGDEVDCNCFGARTTPIGASAVIRNTALVLAAMGAVLGGAGPGVVPQLTSLPQAGWAAFFATTTVGLVVACLVLLTGRRDAAPAMRSDADGAVKPAPDVELLSSWGGLVRLTDLVRARPVLLVLVSADCHACGTVIPQLERWDESFADAVEVMAVTSEQPQVFRAAHPAVGVEMSYGYRALMQAVGLRGVPSAILVARDGTLAAVAEGSDEVEALAATIAGLRDGTLQPDGETPPPVRRPAEKV
jgi:hypothetical protein